MPITSVTATVESLSKDRHGIKINGDWVNNKFKTIDSTVNIGDTVKVAVKDGKFWNYVDKVGAGVPVPGGITSVSATPTYSADERSRTIVRQNSLGHATKLVCDQAHNFIDFNYEESTSTQYGDLIINLARMFECYATGDLDKALSDPEVIKELAEKAVEDAS